MIFNKFFKKPTVSYFILSVFVIYSLVLTITVNRLQSRIVSLQKQITIEKKHNELATPPPIKVTKSATPSSKNTSNTPSKTINKTFSKSNTLANKTPYKTRAENVRSGLSKGVGPVSDIDASNKTAIPVVCTTYHPRFHGRRTASGVVYNHRGYVVACRSGHFRMGTRLAILYGEKKVIVVVGDTGGLPHGTASRKPIDLSGAATEALGLKPGVHKAKCVILND